MAIFAIGFAHFYAFNCKLLKPFLCRSSLSFALQLSLLWLQSMHSHVRLVAGLPMALVFHISTLWDWTI